MERNPKRETVIRNGNDGRFRPPITIPKKTGRAIYGGFDDFISQLTAMKERGGLTISGWRIC